MDQQIKMQNNGESKLVTPSSKARILNFLKIYLLVYIYYLFVDYIFLIYHLEFIASEFVEYSFNMLIWPFMMLYFIFGVNGFNAILTWIISPLIILILSWYTVRAQRTKNIKIVLGFLISLIYVLNFFLMKNLIV